MPKSCSEKEQMQVSLFRAFPRPSEKRGSFSKSMRKTEKKMQRDGVCSTKSRGVRNSFEGPHLSLSFSCARVPASFFLCLL